MNAVALRAALEESKAENEYLRQRNLNLRIAIENLSQQVADLTPNEEAAEGEAEAAPAQ
ncbi:hypothetical protein JWJ88_08650 [Paracoccus methylovorus]|uniref:DUF904 domain-containing protein n=1 Tax=Paracoccus methylovorus TaxID=2812658 RepID=A0ABX7JHE1_9RHOB|nr:hypothetical protein [Paracoccus methylovorus]QRZ12678.1 hypothetical protein JWJ88_08650 [Paracoccus methylovorus]